MHRKKQPSQLEITTENLRQSLNKLELCLKRSKAPELLKESQPLLKAHTPTPTSNSAE